MASRSVYVKGPASISEIERVLEPLGIKALTVEEADEYDGYAYDVCIPLFDAERDIPKAPQALDLLRSRGYAADTQEHLDALWIAQRKALQTS